MKARFVILSLLLASMGSVPAARAAVVSFDDIETGGSHPLLTNGYAGLEWVGFAAFNGMTRPIREGYRTGTVSPSNIVFNIAANSPYIRSAVPFSLESAFLTSAFVDGLQVEVQGWLGATLAHHDTYTLTPSGPTLVQFNYPAVDLVKFFPKVSTIFIMDDLTVTLSNRPPAPLTPLDLGTVQVTNFGHGFNEDPFGPSFAVSFLIDQDQGSGGGGVLSNFTANWDTNSQFTLTVSAPPGMRFLVEVPPGQTALFGGFLVWQSSGGGGCPVGPVSVSFDGLEGTPPDFTGSDAVLADSHGFVGFMEITSSEFSEDIAFSSVTFTGVATPQLAHLGSLNFVPHGECFLGIFSQSTTPDGGATVSIVPQPPKPRIEIVAIFPDAGTLLMVEGLADRTHIVEVSPDLIHWDPLSTFVMPAGVCPTCRPFRLVQDDPRPRPGLRFYRALQVPEPQER